MEPVERLEVCDIDTGRKVRSVNLTRPWDNVRMSLIKGYPSAACCFDGTYAFLPAEVTTSNREETKAEMDLVGINTKTGMLVWSFLHGLLQRDGTPLGIQAPGKEVIFSSFAPSVSYDPDTAADQQTYHLPTTTCRQWTHDARVRVSPDPVRPSSAVSDSPRLPPGFQRTEVGCALLGPDHRVSDVHVWA